MPGCQHVRKRGEMGSSATYFDVSGYSVEEVMWDRFGTLPELKEALSIADQSALLRLGL